MCHKLVEFPHAEISIMDVGSHGIKEANHMLPGVSFFGLNFLGPIISFYNKYTFVIM